VFTIALVAVSHVSMFYSVRYLIPKTVDSGWNGAANRTAFLDGRCDRAVLKVCGDKGSLNCSGI
jgi:hypothetical protein